LNFKFFLDKEFFEASIFSFKSFKAFSFGGRETFIFLSPVVDSLFSDTVFSCSGTNRVSRSFSFSKDRSSLLVVSNFTLTFFVSKIWGAVQRIEGINEGMGKILYSERLHQALGYRAPDEVYYGKEVVNFTKRC